MLSGSKILLICGLILLEFSASAQTLDRIIKWSANPQTHTDTKSGKITVPTFEGALAYPQDGFVPHYNEKVNIAVYGQISATLTNEVYEPLSVQGFKSDQIPTAIKINAIATITRKKPYAAINFVPIRKNPQTGQIEKLVRFSLKIEITATRQNKQLQAYTSNSVLANGTWYKVGVISTGIYKLDYNFLKNKCGFDLANINFSNLAVYGNGGGMIPDRNAIARYDDLQENSTYIVDNNGNNRVDQGDYLLFYAQGPDKWIYDAASFQYEKNLYSDTNFYFVTPTQGTGKRLQGEGSLSTHDISITQFDDYAAHQSDQYNTLHSGKMWYGDRMNSINTSTTLNFSFPNIISSYPVQYSSTVLAASNQYASTFTANLNGGQQVISQSVSAIPTVPDYPDSYEDSQQSGAFTAPSDNFTLVYNYSNPDPNGASNGYLYNVSLHARRSLAFTGGSMFFRSMAAIGHTPQFAMTGATGSTHIWDITDITSIKDISGTNTGGTFSFSVSTPGISEFAAVDISSSFANPIPVESTPNQNLHAIGQPSMIIVTSDELLDAANDLAVFHSQQDHISTKVVTLHQVFTEFGCGKRDISAIRDFVKMMYDRAGSDTTLMPRYLLLMGDGSFDPKDRIQENNNLMPTYEGFNSQNILQSYTSDDFFACLDFNEGGEISVGGQTLDIAVGRIPAANLTEARGMISKIKLYKSTTTLGSWRNMITVIADYPYGGGAAYDFQYETDNLGEKVRLHYPSYNVEKIFTDAYVRFSTAGGDRYPDANTAILNRINNGTLVLSYTGHGGPTNWSNARIFNQSDIQTLQNKEKLPLFVTATCDFSRFDDPTYKTAGEYLSTNAQGGAIAMITTCRPVYEDLNSSLQNTLFDHLFVPYHGRKPTVGELMADTKNSIIGNGVDINTRNFVLLGDPALVLDYPEYNVVTTAVDNVPLSQSHDTLKALKYITISGEVRDWTGAKLTSFNGTCFPLIYDKIGTINTLANGEYSTNSFNQYKNILFKGQCTVTNGAFTFSFIVPKDINYAIGYGRISYYADNGSTDANGYQNDIVIGGADSAIRDTTPPKVKLYMNDEKFIYGGMTDPSPKLLAQLSDKYGINTTGNGLGHDITALLDANSKSPIVLNDYYQSALNNFRQGSVVYPFSNLSEGTHTLKVKAWNILNISAEDNTEFIVASSAKLALKHVLNYPNPFTTNTQFMFEHNRPGDDLKIMIQVYSVSGRLIKTIQEEVITTGYRVDNLRWDGLDDYGDKIGKGVYVYKVHIRDSQGNTADQFQKLVVLR